MTRAMRAALTHLLPALGLAVLLALVAAGPAEARDREAERPGAPVARAPGPAPVALARRCPRGRPGRAEAARRCARRRVRCGRRPSRRVRRCRRRRAPRFGTGAPAGSDDPPAARPVAPAPPPRPAPRPPAPAPPAPEPPPVAPEPLARQVGVLATEFSLVLSRPAVAAGDVLVELVNAGEDPHDLRLAPEAGGGVVATWEEQPPGGVGRRTVRLHAGTWRLWCSLPGHETAGMRVRLVVR